MTVKVDQKLIKQAQDSHKRFWGDAHHDRLIDQAIEEMAELTKALLKWRRALSKEPNPLLTPDATLDEVEKELADVFLCFELLTDELGVNVIEMGRRISRRAGRLKGKLDREMEALAERAARAPR